MKAPCLPTNKAGDQSDNTSNAKAPLTPMPGKSFSFSLSRWCSPAFFPSARHADPMRMANRPYASTPDTPGQILAPPSSPGP